MNEQFKVLFQAGYFKVIDEPVKFKNFCIRHKGKLGTVVIEDGFRITLDEKGEQDNFWDKVGDRND